MLEVHAPVFPAARESGFRIALKASAVSFTLPFDYSAFC